MVVVVVVVFFGPTTLLHPAGGKSMSVPFQWVIVHFLDQCSNI